MNKTQTFEEEFKKHPELIGKDVKALRDWAKFQPHLPKIDCLSDVFLSSFLRRRYYSLEKAKHTLDNYLTFRTLVPELFENASVEQREVKSILESQYNCVAEQVDQHGNAVLFQFIHDPDPTKYIFDGLLKLWLMIGDAWLCQNGSANGITYVFDQRNFSLGHLMRVALPSAKKMNYFNKECSPISVKNVYIINSNAFTQNIMGVLRPALDGKLFDKIRVFTPSDMDEFYENVPKTAIPKDYGGDGRGMKELHEHTVKLLQRHSTVTKPLAFLKVDESKRRGPPMSTTTLFGLEGTFRKLNVD